MTNVLCALRDVRFRYPGASTEALAVDAFVVGAGEQLFVRGPSGSGKTTLLSLLAGVLIAQGGQATLLGEDWEQLPARGRDRLRADHIGYVFQQFNLLPYLSVIANVLLPCRFSSSRLRRAGGSASAAAARGQRLLGRMGLGESLLNRPAATLSVGQQQRVAAARALIGQPELVIADEPTSALDEAVRESFMQTLLEASAEAGSALVFVSHDTRLAARFARQLDLTALNRALPHGDDATLAAVKASA